MPYGINITYIVHITIVSLHVNKTLYNYNWHGTITCLHMFYNVGISHVYKQNKYGGRVIQNKRAAHVIWNWFSNKSDVNQTGAFCKLSQNLVPTNSGNA